MKVYVSPQLVDFGDSTSLIKGNCGWGSENAWLDKTGYYEKNLLRCNSSGYCEWYGTVCTDQPVYNECPESGSGQRC